MTITNSHLRITVEDDDEPFDIADRLKQRLDSTKATKESMQNKINELNNELQVLFTKIPRKPRESLSELQDEINKLEFQRTTTSMKLSDEKALLREIDKVKVMKIQLEDFNAYERKVQEKKANLNDLRDKFKTTIAAIDELEAAWSKVKLANKLGCSVSELTYKSIDVSAEKMGRVIGKNGATIKQLESEHRVVLNVDSVAGKIQLTGSDMAVGIAILEIEKICSAIDVDVSVATDLLTFLTTKRINAMADFKMMHPFVQIEASREKRVVTLRGPPEDVKRCQHDLLTFILQKETRILIGRESSLIVGKGGATINRLVETHKVVIDVTETGEDVFTCTIAGPSVDSAVAEIDSILNANKEVTETIHVDAIMRNTLLTDSGAPIKQLQKTVNDAVKEIAGGGIQLNFSKEDRSILIIKGRHVAMETARKIVNDFLEKIQSSLVTINVDPFAISQLIGKGGETIKKIKGDGVVNIEVDKALGRVTIQSQDDEEVKRVESAIKSILENNNVARIPVSCSRLVFRELLRNDKKDEINAKVWMGLDEDTSTIVLRGTRENVSSAAEIVKEFLSENYIQEVEISPDDEPTLLTGGSESPIQKFQSEYGADLQVTRNRFVVVVRGKKDNVEAAAKRLNQFLHGGDGYTVSRISVTEQALGVVIGKNGAKRAELEKLHEGVHLYIHRSNRITIRGPDTGVEACRVDILRLVSSVKIQQIMKLTADERKKLSDPDIIRKAIQGIPVQVTLEDDSLKIRGIFADVRDAQAMLKEQILGFYEAHVELEASQVSCVRRACRDPSHFERMKAASNADINLDIPNNKIVLTGKKGNVRKAKDLVVGFLEFLIPADFARISLIKPLHTSVGDPAALAEVSAISGANVFLDRDLSALIVQSSNSGKVKKASEILKDKIEKANKLAFLITFPASESWVIPLVIGKGGNRVNALRLDAGCNIDIDKIERTITVTGDKEENVSKARELLSNVIEEARRQCCFIDIPEEAVAAFLGRGGSHIRAFASEYDIECDRMRKSPGKIRITGEESKVQAAKKALETWIEQWEARESGKTIKINKMSIPAVLGKGGSVISALQREFKIKVEIDRDEMTLTVRGSTEEMREKAIAKINHIISEDQDRANNRQGKFDGNGFPKREGDISVGHENGPTLDNSNDRSSEFARRPVGLTVVEQEVTKGNRQRKAKERDISDDSTLQVGSPAGRNLFNLLSDSCTIVNCENINTSVSYNPITLSLMNEEQWDSSTLSSLAADSSLHEDDNKNVDVAKKYVKSASGFSVRV